MMETQLKEVSSQRSFRSAIQKLDLRSFSIGLAVLITVLFWDVLVGMKTFFFRDYALFGYPLAAYHKASFWQGEIPLWNPYNNCGLPFLAQWNTLVLYPLSLIYILFPLTWSLSVFCLFHLWLGGVGMFKLANDWVKEPFAAAIAGLGFALNGLLLSSLKWPNNMAAFGLMPWVVFFARRGWNQGGRALVAAALVAGCQMLSGAPELILITWLFLAFLASFDAVQARKWKVLLRFVGIVAICGALAAAQLLPFLDLLRHSQREANFDGSMWSMPLHGWINFFVPLFRTFPSHQAVVAQQNQYWIASYYPGVLLSALAMLGAIKSPLRGVRWLAGLALFSIILAFGDAAHVLPLVRKFVPVLSMMRFSIKFVVLTIFLLPILAAFGAIELKERKWAGTILLSIAVIILAVAFTDGTSVIWQNAGLRLIILGLGALVLLSPWKKYVQLALPALLIVDVLTHMPWQNPVAPPWVYGSDIVQMKPVPKLGESRAMITPEAEYRLDHTLGTNPVDDVLKTRLSLFCNANLIDAIPKVNGFFSLYLKHEAAIENAIYLKTNLPPAPLLRFLSVSQQTKAGKTVDWDPLSQSQPWVTAGQAPRFGTDAESLSGVQDPAWEPAKTVFLPKEVESQIQVGTNTTVRITNSTTTPHRTEFAVDASADGIVVINQAWYHPWRASVDGSTTTLYRANHAFQAIVVPKGRHNIQVVYQDNAFRLGSCISLAALAGSILYLVMHARRTV